ncbi:acetolactate synthase, large subunit, biosynthetic type [Snodgrassella alvi]|uniref:biosynthetic-type acetolactate synthase large subunit n=1 Tax=Snodgrassella alvi TaxID=1196083 RepID=UPI0009FE0717|nr:biosynthetic-type acetolactate synthase large subunit [Snodgrassella alvi]ORF27695.1 acetolactate synthase, large subunit, biosynthetic type [Snodgrassella alvi]ORF30784.1 acetolactate synthase, large subunit, biosynthetic type [Snodgrassella alvi]ORF35470.1 acetolactate synthase, large subunit, biosynthetic type [Snodgrassella alvi]ORF38830.1 acetolactate synthase, large subunit, biosynthetic type [Snodgrassella alvi]ORF41747.1 acetolactate synthase, large subunit, biosynthetic type [Snodg
MQLSGAQILVQSLKAENVEYVFGYPGGAVLEIYDAIFQLKKFHHILVRHEQAAVHAADAYSRASNGEKIGVALVTSGPGATNAITGIATANSDSVPLVVISGQVGSPAIGTDAFQEVDTVGISRPCVKHNFLVTHVSELAETVKKAFQIARTGRPGVVVIDVPKDVTQAMAKFSYPQEDINIRSYQPVTQGHTGQIKKAAQVMAAAKRPIVLYGGGIILGNASNILTDFIQSTGTPCVSTLMGLGAFPATNRQFLGMVGMHGSYEANIALQNADVVLAVGARFDDRVISVPDKFTDDGKKIIHIDIDPSSIAKRVKVDVPIVGDVKNVLADLLALWQKQNLNFNSNALDRWWKNIENWRSRNSIWFESSDETIKPQQVIQTLAKLTDNNALITSDVGQHQMFTAQYYPFVRPRQWLNSGGLGTMGVGLPYAMGAKLAKPEEDVFCITGEGSIQMNIQELSTCYQYRLPIKVINLNNGFLGMVRQWQELYYDNRYSETYMESLPDFVKLAEAYGHVGIRVEKAADIEGALKEAIALKDRLVFMDFITDRTQNVYPMVGNGKGLDEMVLPPHMREE